MNRKYESLRKRRPDSAFPESRIKDVIRSLQEVEKAIEKIDTDKKKSASS
jgi:hypothetical protein